MWRLVLAAIFALYSLGAQVHLSKVDDDTSMPDLHPLRSASGKIVTRSFPLENIPGESTKTSG
jgi:hypothetical protein